MAGNPTYEEVTASLPGPVFEPLDELMGFLRGMRLSPRWYATGAMSIRYKGKIVMRFTVRGHKVEIYFTIAKPTELDAVLAGQDEDVRAFFLRHLRRCTGCDPRHGGGKPMMVLGRPEQVCAEPELKLINPDATEVRMLKRLALVRRENIALDAIN